MNYLPRSIIPLLQLKQTNVFSDSAMGFSLILENSVAGNKHCCTPIQLFTSQLFPSPHLSTQK